MKKTAIILAITLLLNLVSIVPVSASNYSDSVSTEASYNSITIDGETYTFFKEDMDYKVVDSKGTVIVWACDVLISSSTKQAPSARSQTGWIYIQTDRYATYINYEVLMPLLQGAEALTVLSAKLGIPAAVLAYILSVSPEKYYREDISYYHVSDPLYFMIISNFYKNSSYTQLIDTFTTYRYP